MGDEAMYSDGQISGDGNWRLYLTLRYRHLELDRCHNVGCSDLEADHWLLLDRETRYLVVMPRAEVQARRLLNNPLCGGNCTLTTQSRDHS
jgi:hypothetical protein